jgi:hypothetical protein
LIGTSTKYGKNKFADTGTGISRTNSYPPDNPKRGKGDCSGAANNQIKESTVGGKFSLRIQIRTREAQK